MTPTNAAAFTRNDAPIAGTLPANNPTNITIIIPSTGPTARATFRATEFSATASGNSLGGTGSGMTYWNAGPASAAPIPSSAGNVRSMTGLAQPASVATPSSAETASIQMLVRISRLRRSAMAAGTTTAI